MKDLVDSRFVTGPDEQLQTQDVYDITDNLLAQQGYAVDSRQVSQGINDIFGLPPGKDVDSLIGKTLSLAGETRAALKERSQTLLDQLPGDLKPFVEDRILSQPLDENLLSMDLVWDYVGQTIYLSPDEKEAILGLRDKIRQYRNGNSQAPNFGDDPGRIIDRGAQILVNTGIVDEAIVREATPIIKELLNDSADNEVRRHISERSFPTVINRGDRNGPDPRGNDAWDVPVNNDTERGPFNQPDVYIAPRFGQSNRPNAQLSSDGGGIALEQDRRGFDREAVEVLFENTTGEQLRTRFPGIIGSILYYYRMPVNESLESEYEYLTTLLSRIDADWVDAQRGEQSIQRLSHLARASSDAIFVLTAYGDSSLRSSALIARSYRPRDIRGLLRRQYPYASI